MSGLRFILVGVGARSRIWRRVLDEHLDCSIVGAVEIDDERRAVVEAEWGGPGRSEVVWGGSIAEVAEAVDADVALLCTPPAGRQPQIDDACRAGLAILAEKPLADSLPTAAAFVEQAERAGVPLSVALNFRYLAVTQALKALFAEDRLGPAEFGRFTYERWRDGWLPHLNRYPLTMAQPMLWEQSIHHFDLMRFVYDAEPVQVSARTFNPSWSMYRGDANVGALFSFDGGIEVTYQGTWAGNWQTMGFDWRTDCRNGVAIQRDMFGDLHWARTHDEHLTPVRIAPSEPWLDDARGLLADFVRCLMAGEAPPCSGVDHLNSLRMVDACIRSSERQMTVSLN
jgi:predicted dehydrogenase